MAGALGIAEGVKSEGQGQKEERKEQGSYQVPMCRDSVRTSSRQEDTRKPGVGDSSGRCLLALLKVKNEEETCRQKTLRPSFL